MTTTASIRGTTDIERAQYKTEGCAVLRQFIDASVVTRLCNRATDLLDALEGSYRMVWGPHRWDQVFNEFVWDSEFGLAMSHLMGARDIRLFTSEVWAKEPGSEQPIDWHNDISYYPFSDARICSIWIALVDVSHEMSGMDFIPRSHEWKRRFKPHVPNGAPGKARIEAAAFEELPDFADMNKRYPGVINLKSWDLRAGDAIAFTGWTLHHTGPNLGDRRRVAFSVRAIDEVGAVFEPRESTSWPAEVDVLRLEGKPPVRGYPALVMDGVPAPPPALDKPPTRS
jgi:hypothetical protein